MRTLLVLLPLALVLTWASPPARAATGALDAVGPDGRALGGCRRRCRLRGHSRRRAVLVGRLRRLVASPVGAAVGTAVVTVARERVRGRPRCVRCRVAAANERVALSPRSLEDALQE